MAQNIGGLSMDQGGICQVFEIINKENVGDKTCPETINNLKPISFKDFGSGDYQNNFPKMFLFAVKYKNDGFKTTNPVFVDIYTKNNTESGNKLIGFYFSNQTKCQTNDKNIALTKD